jgi:hypothetical protein
MQPQIVLKTSTPEELNRKWGKCAWEETPSHIVAFPFPGGVLFGAEQRHTAHRLSFFLSVEDARIVGWRLLNAAREAENAVS